jgi:outer membrane lipopolysaccharide assembly protein LptE/RlpB
MKPSPAPAPQMSPHSDSLAWAAIRIAVLLLAMAGAPACGYSLSGRASTLPPEVQTIGIPMFVNQTDRPELDQRITEHIIDQFVIRGRVRIVPGEEGAQAVLTGTIFSYTSVPVVINEQGRATRYEIMITARVVLREVGTDRTLWSDDRFLFKEQYEVAKFAETFIDREIIAIDEVAGDFARRIVSSILEGF